MKIIPDSLIPANRDCIEHRITKSGSFPKTHYTVEFQYEDGSVRTFDGANWKVAVPRREIRLDNQTLGTEAFSSAFESYRVANQAEEYNNL